MTKRKCERRRGGNFSKNHRFIIEHNKLDCCWYDLRFSTNAPHSLLSLSAQNEKLLKIFKQAIRTMKSSSSEYREARQRERQSQQSKSKNLNGIAEERLAMLNFCSYACYEFLIQSSTHCAAALSSWQTNYKSCGKWPNEMKKSNSLHMNGLRMKKQIWKIFLLYFMFWGMWEMFPGFLRWLSSPSWINTWNQKSSHKLTHIRAINQWQTQKFSLSSSFLTVQFSKL